jgi:hypothetical protein
VERRRPTNFCSCLERVLGLEAVKAEWRRALGADWTWAGRLLLPTDRVAACYPKPAGAESPLPFRIVWWDEAADCYVGSCPDGTGTIELRRSALVVYELDRSELARRVAAALGLAFAYGEVEGVPQAERVGVRDAMTDDEAWVYAVLQGGRSSLSEALHRLADRSGGRPFTVITPTRAPWAPRAAGPPVAWRLSAMIDALEVDPDGKLWSVGDGSADGRCRPPTPGPELPATRAAPPSGTPTSADPVSHDAWPAFRADRRTFTVHLGERSLRFEGRSTLLFSLLARLADRPGHRVTFDELCEHGGVWDDRRIEDTTIRGTVARLRKALKDGGLHDVADALSTGRFDGAPFAVLTPPDQLHDGAH